MGIPNTSDAFVLTGSSNSPVQDFLKNPPPKHVPAPVSSATPASTLSSPNQPFSEDDRNRIGAKLTEAITKAVQSGILNSEDQLGEIIDDILILINNIQTHEDLGLVFDALSDKWPFLSPVIAEERKQYAAVKHVEKIFKKQANNHLPTVS